MIYSVVVQVCSKVIQLRKRLELFCNIWCHSNTWEKQSHNFQLKWFFFFPQFKSLPFSIPETLRDVKGILVFSLGKRWELWVFVYMLEWPLGRFLCTRYLSLFNNREHILVENTQCRAVCWPGPSRQALSPRSSRDTRVLGFAMSCVSLWYRLNSSLQNPECREWH